MIDSTLASELYHQLESGEEQSTSQLPLMHNGVLHDRRCWRVPNHRRSNFKVSRCTRSAAADSAAAGGVIISP